MFVGVFVCQVMTFYIFIFFFKTTEPFSTLFGPKQTVLGWGSSFFFQTKGHVFIQRVIMRNSENRMGSFEIH